mgnify:FL=1
MVKAEILKQLQGKLCTVTYMNYRGDTFQVKANDMVPPIHTKSETRCDVENSIIIGLAVASVALLFLIIIVIWFLKRRERMKRRRAVTFNFGANATINTNSHNVANHGDTFNNDESIMLNDNSHHITQNGDVNTSVNIETTATTECEMDPRTSLSDIPASNSPPSPTSSSVGSNGLSSNGLLATQKYNHRGVAVENNNRGCDPSGSLSSDFLCSTFEPSHMMANADQMIYRRMAESMSENNPLSDDRFPR